MSDSTEYYYEAKQAILQDLFGTSEMVLAPDCLVVKGCKYPILDDVIILLDESEYPRRLAERMKSGGIRSAGQPRGFQEDIQFTFGEEWSAFPDILAEHETEFRQYFDLVDLSQLTNCRICDLGCGAGRWSFFLSTLCREVILVDFSDAIFAARRNLSAARNALFFLGDLTRLPFRNDFADLIVCLGVLHHLPKPALEAVRELHRRAPRLLCYLYYALDNRPFYFRTLLAIVTRLRLTVSAIRSPEFRNVFTWLVTVALYMPLVALGRSLRKSGRGWHVPLYETYVGKSLERIRQDAYDRFFTRIEQRHSRREILALTDIFSKVTVSDHIPYWHFICER